jgi:pimeloyl-ACP methyl ester carboxylesterase
MYYEVHGDGDPLLLILGLALDVSEVGAIVEGLSTRFRTIVFDNRGSGRSGHPVGPYSIPMMADDAVGLLDNLLVPSARIVGISMGARIAMDVAIRYPQRVADLVLVGAQYKSRGKLHTSLPMKLAALIAWLGFVKESYPQPRESFEAQRDASLAYDCEAGLATIRARTLILHGRRDRSAPFAQAAEMSRRIPAATLKSYRGGHLFFLMGERDEFIDAVLGF